MQAQAKDNKNYLHSIMGSEVVLFSLSCGEYIWDAKGCEISAEVGSSLIDHYCCKNFIERQTQAVALGKAILNHSKQSLLAGWTLLSATPWQYVFWERQQGSKGVWKPKAYAVTDRTLHQSPFPSWVSTKNLREMEDLQQTVGKMMKDRAVTVWHLQTAHNKISFLHCVFEES